MARSSQKPKNPSRSGKNQTERLIDKARELGCDEDEAAFDATLNAVAGPKPVSAGASSPLCFTSARAER